MASQKGGLKTTTHIMTEPILSFSVHSTYRDNDGRLLLPDGLEWNLPGTSHLSYVSIPARDLTSINLCSNQVKQGIVEAHNRWCFAKDLAFRRVEEIQDLSMIGKNHIHVEWMEQHKKDTVIFERRHENLAELIQKAAAAAAAAAAKAKDGSSSSATQVWINGHFVAILQPDTVPQILAELSHVQEQSLTKLTWKQQLLSAELIRIERYFHSYLRNRDQIFDHVMDNLYAMEDITVLDEDTIIGTATLPDWIMGGDLTSRLYVRDEEHETGDIVMLRPLHKDDIATSDRRFRLVKGQDDDKLRLVRAELARLRHLASLEHPFEKSLIVKEQESNDSSSSSSPQVTHRHQTRRPKIFGL